MTATSPLAALETLRPYPCRCGNGSCMLCDDDGMRHVEVVIPDGREGYVASVEDNRGRPGWVAVHITNADGGGDSDYFHFSTLTLIGG